MNAIKATGFVVGGRRYATLDSATAAANKVLAKTGAIVAIEAIAPLIGESIERMARAGREFGPGDYTRLGDRLMSWEYMMST